MLRDPAEQFGRLLARLFVLRVAHGQDAVSQARERGVEPAAIATVVLTHLHYDHAGAARRLPAARFVSSRSLLDVANVSGIATGIQGDSGGGGTAGDSPAPRWIRTLKPRSPQPRQPPPIATIGEIERRDRLGGLTHEYHRTAA